MCLGSLTGSSTSSGIKISILTREDSPSSIRWTLASFLSVFLDILWTEGDERAGGDTVYTSHPRVCLLSTISGTVDRVNNRSRYSTSQNSLRSRLICKQAILLVREMSANTVEYMNVNYTVYSKLTSRKIINVFKNTNMQDPIRDHLNHTNTCTTMLAASARLTTHFCWKVVNALTK